MRKIKIICTADEYVRIVHKCHDAQRRAHCLKCPLYIECVLVRGDVSSFVDKAAIVWDDGESD